MAKKKVKKVSPQFKKNVQMIQPPALGIRNVARKLLGKAAKKGASKFKLPGQKKAVKVKHVGTNPTSLRNLKGDKINFPSFRHAATTPQRRIKKRK